MIRVLKTATAVAVFSAMAFANDSTTVQSSTKSDTSKVHASISGFGEYSFKSAPDPLKEEWKNGFGGGVGLELYDRDRLSFLAALTLRGFGLDENGVKENIYKEDPIDTANLDFDISPIMMLETVLGLKVRARSEGFTPFASASAGYLTVFGGQGTISYQGIALDMPAIETDAIVVKASGGVQYRKMNTFGFYAQGSACFGLSLGGDNYGYYPMELGVMIPLKL